MRLPDLTEEIKLWEKGYTVIGIDEVGRGAFAGPLTVGGVIFKPCFDDEERLKYLLKLGINDSKKLKPLKRKTLSNIIQSECLDYEISSISVADINRLGIGKATFRAMRKVVGGLLKKDGVQNVFVLVDGFHVKYLKGLGLKNQKAIIRGDSISLSIAAASIIAKTFRDNYMLRLSSEHPEYGWGRNKGYGSFEHREAIKRLGKTIHHRDDFIENFLPK